MKKMKLISGLVAAAMAAISMSSVLANAADVSVKVGKATDKKAGDTFSVDVSLSGVPSGGLSSVEFSVKYDSSLVKITGVELGEIGNTGAASAEGSDLGDTVWSTYDTGKEIVMLWSTGLTDSKYFIKSDGVLAKISGQVLSGAKEGDVADLTVVPVSREIYPKGGDNKDILFSAVTSDGSQDYAAAKTDGAVVMATGGDTTDTPPSGDVEWGNVDCKEGVNVADAVLLARYVAEDKEVNVTAQGLKNANVYVDSSSPEKIDANDNVTLLELLAGLKKDSEMPIKK